MVEHLQTVFFGPQGVYILASYLAALLILGGMLISSWLSLRSASRRLAEIEGRRARGAEDRVA